MNTLLNKFGKAQTVLLVIILLLIGGLAGGALVYISVFKNIGKTAAVMHQPTLVFPSGSSMQSFAPIVAAVKPAVVNIHTEQIIKSPFRGIRNPFGRDPFFEEFFGEDFFRRFFDDQWRDSKVTNLGSGVIIDPAGYILTNNHVVDRADKISVKLADGTLYKAEIVGKDPKTDIAVLKITRIGGGFPVAKLGDSDTINVGDYVLAIGIPFGLSETVTHGIISALGRRGFGVADYEDFIQTDAPINPGNSGGPLVNMKGEVIGINTFIVTQGAPQSAGVGFAIPSNIARKVYIDLRAKGKVVRGYLGVGLQDLTPELAQHFGVKQGVLITNVWENSPAAKIGLKPDDVIIRFDGKAIKNGSELRNLVGNTPVGKKVELEIWRDHKAYKFQVTIAEMPTELSTTQPEASETVPDKLGLTVKNITPEIARELNLRRTSGVVIIDIDSSSPASDILQPGDVLLKINDIEINTIADYNRALAKLKKGDTVILRIYRDGGYLYVTIQLE
ncbi:MAG: Do family serine endopeptidase [bacterium]|nr:Do family serine endopeptidase [bacterium]